MGILLSLSPWVIMWVLGGPKTLGFAVWISLGIALAVSGFGVYRRNIKILDIGTLVFFASIAVASLFVSKEWLSDWGIFMAGPALLLIVLVSIAIKQPFTIQYAKEQVPREVWEHPLFYSINVTIAWVWAAEFTLLSASNLVAIYISSPKIVFRLVIPVAGFVTAALFSRWYPNWKQKKFFAELEASGETPPQEEATDA